MVIDYQQNEFCDFQKLEKSMWWLWKKQYEIVYHGPIAQTDLSVLTPEKLAGFIKDAPEQKNIKGTIMNRDRGYYRFVCRKRSSLARENDDVSMWTFGIITRGERTDFVDEIIESIRQQKIPHYEIIICGTYNDRKEKDITYIPFSQRDDKGWITKKKNLIVERARYENLCLLHDRIVFDKEWFIGMKTYGNCFELLTNVQAVKKEGYRAGDWMVYDGKYRISQLDYEDWDHNVYVSGQLTILKKSIWEENPWDETLYWNEEDVVFSFRARDEGYLPRFNYRSSCTALTWRHGRIPTKYDISKGLLPKDMLLRRLMRTAARTVFMMPGLKETVRPILEKIVRSKTYHFLAHH